MVNWIKGGIRRSVSLFQAAFSLEIESCDCNRRIDIDLFIVITEILCKMKYPSLVDSTSDLLISWRRQTSAWSSSRRGPRPRIIANHPTSSIDFVLSFHPPFPATRNFTLNEVSMLPPTDYVFRSGVARCTLAGLAARTTRSLLLQTCSVEGVERQWPGGGESWWWRYRERPGSNDVCLALEERPLAGLEDTGFGTKMMAKGWDDQPVSRRVPSLSIPRGRLSPSVNWNSRVLVSVDPHLLRKPGYAN